MKNWMLLLIVLILVGCVSNPVPEPDWSKAEREPKEVVDPVSLPTLWFHGLSTTRSAGQH
jgi:PBP1b-binding outer membrane lipoprotein LpoB